MIKDRLKNVDPVREDEDAVSPVIGVIMMVAVTVILAAVVGAFVFGVIGEPKAAPQVTLNVEDAEWNYGSGTDTNAFVITHNGGDDIPGQDLKVVVADLDGVPQATFDEDNSWSPSNVGILGYNGNTTALTATDQVSTGDALIIKDNGSDTFDDNTKYSIRIVDVRSENTISKAEVELR